MTNKANIKKALTQNKNGMGKKKGNHSTSIYEYKDILIYKRACDLMIYLLTKQETGGEGYSMEACGNDT